MLRGIVHIPECLSVSLSGGSLERGFSAVGHNEKRIQKYIF